MVVSEVSAVESKVAGLTIDTEYDSLNLEQKTKLRSLNLERHKSCGVSKAILNGVDHDGCQPRHQPPTLEASKCGHTPQGSSITWAESTADTRELHRHTMATAWEALKQSIVYFRGQPIGTVAAIDKSHAELNYDQVFTRDFVPSALTFLMKGEPLLVKNFLLETARLQSREKMVDPFKLGQGVMPVCSSSHLTQKTETLLADFGEIAIGGVTPVDSGLWWIFLLRAYTPYTFVSSLAESPHCLKLWLSEGFDTSPALLSADGCSMFDLRMVSMSDFVPSALAFLMKGEPLIVKNFLLETARLQSREKMADIFKLGQGVMPASFSSHLTQKTETLLADFGGIAIGRVAPVDSRLWWISLPQHLDAEGGALELNVTPASPHTGGNSFPQHFHDGGAAPSPFRPRTPASPPRPRRRRATGKRRGCGAVRTSTPMGKPSPEADAGVSQLGVRGGAGGAANKRAAADIYLARAEGNRWIDRLILTIELGPRFWFQEFMDWVYMMRGTPRDRIRDSWTWLRVVRMPIEQHDGSCVISSTLVCLEARHRLCFERQHGFGTFPFHIPAGTVEGLKILCRKRGIWTKAGMIQREVLEVLRQAGGSLAAKVPGWKRCKLQFKSWNFHYSTSLTLMPPSEIAELIYAEGPLLGGLFIGPDYYADGWEDRVYRGVPASQEGAFYHSVVCIGYRYDSTGQPHGVPELQVEIMDNQESSGPIRWIASAAFTYFCEVHVEPLDVIKLRLPEPRWWRRLLSSVRGIFVWIFSR